MKKLFLNFFSLATLLMAFKANALVVNGKVYNRDRNIPKETAELYVDFSSLRDSTRLGYKSVDIIVNFKQPASDGARSASIVWGVDCSKNLTIHESQTRYSSRNGTGDVISTQYNDTSATGPEHVNSLKNSVCSRYSSVLSSVGRALAPSTLSMNEKKRSNNETPSGLNKEEDECKKKIQKLEQLCATAGDIERCMVIKGREVGVSQGRDYLYTPKLTCS